MATRSLLIHDGTKLTSFANADNLVRKGPGIPCGRLSLTTTVPVTTSDVTAAGTLYYIPYNGDTVSIPYDGLGWADYTLTEIGIALVVTSGSNYDVFIYDADGVLTLELSAAWTNDTTRADALTLLGGAYVKSAAPTRRYIGTIRASGLDTCEDSAAKRFVWNAYNRVPRFMKAIDATDSWTYTGSGTWRQANAAAGNKVEYVSGLVEILVKATVLAAVTAALSASDQGVVGVGVDSTSANSAQIFTTRFSSIGGDFGSLQAAYSGYPGIGYHYLAWVENSGASSVTFIGDYSATLAVAMQSGIMAEVLA